VLKGKGSPTSTQGLGVERNLRLRGDDRYFEEVEAVRVCVKVGGGDEEKNELDVAKVIRKEKRDSGNFLWWTYPLTLFCLLS
jgi:hypothetical protein